MSEQIPTEASCFWFLPTEAYGRVCKPNPEMTMGCVGAVLRPQRLPHCVSLRVHFSDRQHWGWGGREEPPWQATSDVYGLYHAPSL